MFYGSGSRCAAATAVGCGKNAETGDSSFNGAAEENGAFEAEDPDISFETEDPDSGYDQDFGHDSGINESYFAALGGWKHFNFKPGQFMKYSVTSARGLEGWASIMVDSGEGDNLDQTIEGYRGIGEDISETATLVRGMMPTDFTYTISSDASNLLSSLFNATNIPFHQVEWTEGHRWEDGEIILEVGGEETYAGVTGRVVSYEAPHAFTGEPQNYIYVINLDYPLPLFVECPAANDTWYMS